ncbi:tryptase-related [Holotrichia oblita]|uniref:Tryptase-related n=1 Tax=Holotrichia oblita TaxID=644536 RepID=A0ACB9SQY2_HOLOL|nr:tryptase-related [Holotrichia oblita]
MPVSKCFILQILVTVLWVMDINTVEHCGRTTKGAIPIQRIVGGYDVKTYKYPWFVALKRMDIVHCGGTLIAESFFVTAAHCFNKFLKAVEFGHMKLEDVYTPVLGAYNVCRHEPTQREFKMKAVYLHENYQTENHYYDIALVKLDKPAIGFEKCCLPTKAISEAERPKEEVVAGFGDLEWQTIVVTCTMHEAKLLTYSDEVCRNMLKMQHSEEKGLKKAYCAGYLPGGIDACQGDSGGPLLEIESSDRYTLVGKYISLVV